MALSGRFIVVALVALALLAASTWRGRFADVWLTPDQQGRLHFERGAYLRAARAFEDPLWKGLAAYSAGDFVAASALFEKLDDANAHFYRGNSFAHRDMLDEAVAAYTAALALAPDFSEARFNLDWVAGILEFRNTEYDDAGGTGGKLNADGFVVDDRAKESSQTMSAVEARAQGLTDAQLEEMWMRRVQTTPGDFLALKFAYQQADEAEQ